MITHTPSTVSIFATDNYKLFTMINGNRGINTGKVNRIIAEVESGNDMLRYYPIQVKVTKDKLEILDGQHRFMICKKLKRQVHYIIVTEDKSMKDIAVVNSNTEKWRGQDFINCYIAQGNDNYIQLQKFITEYGFGLGMSIILLTTGAPGKDGSNQSLMVTFHEGKLEVTHYKEAVAAAEEAKQFDFFEFWKDRAFLIAIHRIKEARLITIDQLLAQVKKYPEMLVKNHSQKQYIYCLEQIMNHNKQKRITII